MSMKEETCWQGRKKKARGKIFLLQWSHMSFQQSMWSKLEVYLPTKKRLDERSVFLP